MELKDYFNEKTTRFLMGVRTENGRLLLTAENVRFLSMDYAELDKAIRYCANANETKKVLKNICSNLIINYNDSSSCYCVYLSGVFCFSYYKPRGWGAFYINENWYKDSKGKNQRYSKVIDRFKHEYRYSYCNFGSLFLADRNEPLTRSVWEVNYEWRNNHNYRTIKLKGTNGILLYKHYQEAIRRVQKWMQNEKLSIDSEISSCINKLTELQAKKTNFEEKSDYAKSIRVYKQNINRLLGKPLEDMRGEVK